MPDSEATEAIIQQIYKTYYAEMGGAGSAPELPAHSGQQATNNVTAFKRPVPQRKPIAQAAMPGPQAKPRLPVALIFAVPRRRLRRHPVLFLAVKRARRPDLSSAL